MKAELIFTGTELLLGQILNTNAQYLSKRLAEIGIDVYFQTCVGDNLPRIVETINSASGRSDLVLVSGGLGPTGDDLSREALAASLNLPLELNQQALEHITTVFKKRHFQMTPNNQKQALFPQGAKPIRNDVGTAPGVLLEGAQTTYILLPGPPHELELMFEQEVVPYLQQRMGGKKQIIVSRVMRLFGIGESVLDEQIKDLLQQQSNPTIAPLAKVGEVNLRITAKADAEAEARKLIGATEALLLQRLAPYVFGFDEDSLEAVVGSLLMEGNLTISCAESCTGGLIASKLTDIAGSSQYMQYGIVTYSNWAKQHFLGVQERTLEKFGAVSEETAREMVAGVQKIGQTDLALAVTGIAGPGGGSEQKPVGLVYIAVANQKEIICKEYRFMGNRANIKQLTANAALNMVRVLLLKEKC